MDPPDKPERSKFATGVVDPALVILAFLAFMTSRGLEKRIDTMSPITFDAFAALNELANRAMTVQEQFDAEVSVTTRDLPVDIDQDLKMLAISSAQEVLYIGYEVTGPMDDFHYGHFPWLRDHFCAPDVFGRAIDRGGKLTFSVFSKEDRVSKTYQIGKTDCSV